MNGIDKKKYETICRYCDKVLLENKANKVTIAIRWLHVLRWHPEYLKSYNYLFNKSKIQEIIKFRVGLFLRYFLVLIKNLLRSFFHKSYWYRSHALPKKVDVLFVSHLLTKNEALQENDFYFGSLVDSLKSHGYNSAVVLIDHTTGFQRYKISGWGKQNAPRLILSKVLPLYEEIKLYFIQWKEHLRLNSYQVNLSGFHKKIAKEASIHVLSPSTTSTLRLTKQIQKLLKELEVKIIVTTYEGQAWERLIFSIARANNSNVKCIGYLNAAVFEFQHSIRRSLSMTYDPDIILTPGDISKGHLEGLYNNNTLIDVLGSSRFQKLGINQARKINTKTCLVAPEGILSECNIMFEYSILCAIRYPEINFIWRLHPRLNFTDLLKINSKLKKLPSNIILSTNTLEEDISSSTHILYRGSTVVISSISLGLIPIYLKIKDELGIDPIYNCKRGRIVVQKVSDFAKAIEVDHNKADIKYLTAYGRSFFMPFDVIIFKKFLID